MKLGFEEDFAMSAVDKKLADQIMRLGKNAAHVLDLQYEGRFSEQGQKNRAAVRAVIERGMGTLPFEQRVLATQEYERGIVDTLRGRVVRLLGTWDSMDVDRFCAEFPQVEPERMIAYCEEEGIIDRSTIDGREVVSLSEEGKRQFARDEERLDSGTQDLFAPLNEYEKMQLYLLLRKMLGTPAFDAAS